MPAVFILQQGYKFCEDWRYKSSGLNELKNAVGGEVRRAVKLIGVQHVLDCI